MRRSEEPVQEGDDCGLHYAVLLKPISAKASL